MMINSMMLLKKQVI